MARAKGEDKQQQQPTTPAMGFVGNTGIGSGVHLDVRGWESDKRQKRMSKERLEELAKLIYAGDKPITDFPITSGYGKRDISDIVPGASTEHYAFDFGIPRGTPVTYQDDYVEVLQKPNLGKAGNVVEIMLPSGEVLQMLHLEGFGDIVGKPAPRMLIPAPQQIPVQMPITRPQQQTPEPVAIPSWLNEALQAEEDRRRKQVEAESFMGMLKGTFGL